MMDRLNNKSNLIVDILGFDGKEWTIRLYLYDGEAKIMKMSKNNDFSMFGIQPADGIPDLVFGLISLRHHLRIEIIG